MLPHPVKTESVPAVVPSFLTPQPQAFFLQRRTTLRSGDSDRGGGWQRPNNFVEFVVKLASQPGGSSSPSGKKNPRNQERIKVGQTKRSQLVTKLCFRIRPETKKLLDRFCIDNGIPLSLLANNIFEYAMTEEIVGKRKAFYCSKYASLGVLIEREFSRSVKHRGSHHE
jgi:hypothetical protein